MARIRDILTGAATALAQLAQWFRLGSLGGTQPPLEAQPGRTELRDPEQIVQELISRHLQPEAGAAQRQSERYICVYTDTDSGEVLGRVPMEVEYDVGTARSTRYGRARRAAWQAALSPNRSPTWLKVDPEELLVRNVKTTCKLISRIDL